MPLKQVRVGRQEVREQIKQDCFGRVLSQERRNVVGVISRRSIVER